MHKVFVIVGNNFRLYEPKNRDHSQVHAIQKSYVETALGIFSRKLSSFNTNNKNVHGNAQNQRRAYHKHKIQNTIKGAANIFTAILGN